MVSCLTVLVLLSYCALVLLFCLVALVSWSCGVALLVCSSVLCPCRMVFSCGVALVALSCFESFKIQHQCHRNRTVCKRTRQSFCEVFYCYVCMVYLICVRCNHCGRHSIVVYDVCNYCEVIYCYIFVIIAGGILLLYMMFVIIVRYLLLYICNHCEAFYCCIWWMPGEMCYVMHDSNPRRLSQTYLVCLLPNQADHVTTK